MYVFKCKSDWLVTLYPQTLWTVKYTYYRVLAMTLYISAVPSSAPQSPQGVAVGPMLLSITWLPPPAIDTNGVIKHYLIEATENITGQVVISNATEEHILVRVRPGIEYRCRVAAFTIGLGPFTHYFNVTSQESGTNNIMLYIIINVYNPVSIAYYRA